MNPVLPPRTSMSADLTSWLVLRTVSVRRLVRKVYSDVRMIDEISSSSDA